jgi:hypothetical protein
LNNLQILEHLGLILAKIKSPISNNHVSNHFDMALMASCKYKLEESDALSQVEPNEFMYKFGFQMH